MKIVGICSLLRGEIKGNIRKANDYCRFAAQEGVVPLAPHTIFTQFLDDTIPEERLIGLTLGLELIKRVDEVWVFGVRISEGMEAEILLAEQMDIPIKYFNEKCERVEADACRVP